MKRISLILILVFITSNIVQARLHETKDQMMARLGEPTHSSVKEGFEFKSYEKNAFTIKVWFHKSKAVKIEYLLPNAEKSTIDALIKKNIREKLIPVANPRTLFEEMTSWNGSFFKTADGKCIANIYGARTRVMTSTYFSLLKEYQEQEKLRQAEAKKLKEEREARLIEPF